jgi:DNA-binding transcriptional MocR family regulator
MALWVRPNRKIDTEQWAESARKLDVHFDPSSHYSFDGDRYGGVRLGFASLAEEELKEASQRLFHSFMETHARLVKNPAQSRTRE